MNFDQRVWELTRKIPKGKVTTYKSIAEKLGTKAYRAAGNSLNRNPYGFLSGGDVPCHRVVRSDCRIGGFAHSKRKKIELLKKEGVVIRDGRVDPESVFLF